ncbi:MAG: hypothetical protein AAFV93_17900 [Chloroflexota bacterium]
MGKVPKEVVDKRRDIVASLLARGMRQSEIVSQLSVPSITRIVDGEAVTYPNPSYLVNPKTDKPFDKATISRDFKSLREQWQGDAKVNADEHFSRQFAEIQEAKRVAWAQKNMTEVRQLIALEMKLLGTSQPEKKEIRWDDKQLEQMQTAKERVREKLEMMSLFEEASGSEI